MKKVLSLLLCAAILCSLCSGLAEVDYGLLLSPVFPGGITFSEKETLPLYLYVDGYTDEMITSEVEVLYPNGVRDLPYISVEKAAELLTAFERAAHEDVFTVTAQKVDSEKPAYILLRENATDYALVNFADQTIVFGDLDAFMALPIAAGPMDLVEARDPSDSGGLYLLKRDTTFYRRGGGTAFNLADYGISLYWEDGDGYLPLQTFSDVFGTRLGFMTLFNGKAVFLGTGAEDEPVKGLYYAGEKGKKSPELTQFTYSELCLALDSVYGLMEEHRITSFNRLFLDSGLTTRLRSDDSGDVYNALVQLTCDIFADGHSMAVFQSYSTDNNASSEENAFRALNSALPFLAHMMYYTMARSAAFPEGAPGYQEVDDTAIITFDSFWYDLNRDYYHTELTNNPKDTVELMLYANTQIRREGSPIKNVVIDLTNNGGGMIDAAVCLISWVLGSTTMSTYDSKTGSQSGTTYAFDANLNRMIDPDSSDCLLNMMTDAFHVYCLISPSSFSCGNMVPAALNASKRVTLIGRPSSGGACAVFAISTADGNAIHLSGPLVTSTVVNGSHYSVDQGVEPHVYVDKVEHLYDREYLVNLIHQLP